MSRFQFASRTRTLTISAAIGAGALVAPGAALADGGSEHDDNQQHSYRWSWMWLQQAHQSIKGGDQYVKQSNDPDVTQKQGNGNANVSPSIGFSGLNGKGYSWSYGHQEGGDKGGYGHDNGDDGASTENSQGNHNDADATVIQGNIADQTQKAMQHQVLGSGDGDEGEADEGHDGWFGKSEQSGDQSVKGGDQEAKQSNDADVTQKQGNGN